MGAGEEVKTLYSNAASSGIGTVTIPEEYLGQVKTTLQEKSSVGQQDLAEAIGGGVIIASDKDEAKSTPVSRNPSKNSVKKSQSKSSKN